MSFKSNIILNFASILSCVICLGILAINLALGKEISLLSISILFAIALFVVLGTAIDTMKRFTGMLNSLRKEAGVAPSPTAQNELEEISSIVKAFKNEINCLEQKVAETESRAMN